MYDIHISHYLLRYVSIAKQHVKVTKGKRSTCKFSVLHIYCTVYPKDSPNSKFYRTDHIYTTYMS